MPNRLLLYDLVLFRRSFADAFSRPRDKLLLVLMLAFAFFWLRARVGEVAASSLPPETAWWGGLAGLISFGWQRLLVRRLTWFTQESALTADALARPGRRLYLAVAHLPLLMLVVPAVAMVGMASGRALATGAAAALAYLAGVALASIETAPRHPPAPGDADDGGAPYRGPAGSRAVLHAVVRFQTLSGGRPSLAAGATILAAFLLTLAGCWFARDADDIARFAAALLPAVLPLIAATRLDSGLLGFLPFAGYRPSFVAFAVSALPVASLAGIAAAILLARPEGWPVMLGVLLLLGLLFALIAVARAWLYPGRSARAVHLQLQIELAGLIVIAFLLPPAAPVALGVRLWLLHRRYSSLLWMHF